MAEIITMPRLSDTMTEGVVAKWLKKVGDKIEEGDILAEIETDKATMEFESFHEGTLLHIGVNEGETASVDALLAIIGAEGDDFSALLESSNGSEAATEAEALVEASSDEKASETVQVAAPTGVEVVTMPRLSDTMTEGTVAKWLKNVGDTVDEGDILAEIETDKATMEFESFHQGTLLYIGVEEGSSATVDAVLAIIGEKGTDVAAFAESLKNQAAQPKAAETKKEPAAKPAASPAPVKTEAKPAAAPVVTTTNDGGRIVASPLAKKLAAERNINLSHIQGTGRRRKDHQKRTLRTIHLEVVPVLKCHLYLLARRVLRKYLTHK